METFEFLNILQVHGFPKVMGVLTHLDMISSAKTVKKTKKRLKQRFWTEIYQVLYIASFPGRLLERSWKTGLGKIVSGCSWNSILNLAILWYNYTCIVRFFPSRVLNCFTCLVLSTANTQNQRCTIWLDSSLWWSYPPWSGVGHIPTSLSTGWRIWQNQRRRGSTLSVIVEYVSMVTREELASSQTLLCTYQVWSVAVQLCKDSGKMTLEILL